MQITISFPSGFDVAGVVLSITGARLRVAVRDWDDAAEFQYRDGQWLSENRDPVQIVWSETWPGAGTEIVAMERWCGLSSLQAAPDRVN